MEDLFRLLRLLEAGTGDVVQDIQRLVQEHFSEAKDSWLVDSLYDRYVSIESARLLQLLLLVREPHDKFFLDKMCEGVRQGGAPRGAAFSVLGCVVRKQPPWLYKVCQHPIMKEWVKVLKTEDDLVVLLSALMDLLALMPILPSHLAHHLTDFFEIFRCAQFNIILCLFLPSIT
jgi:tuberous sclerosis protein 1